MSYRYLSEQLRPTADAAARFFKRRWGVSSFRVEEAIPAPVDYSPALHAITHDHHLLCIEVSESPYPAALDSFVLDCMRLCLPVRLFVALPEGARDQNYNRDLGRARDCGVGVLEVSQIGAKIIHNPLSLSLAGLRSIDLETFPRKYRLALSQAEETFKAGNPAKGCSLIYDEIEDLTRKVAKRISKKGLFKTPKPNQKPPRVNFDTAPWQKVIRTLMDHLDPQKCRFLSQALLGRMLGITPHRNEASHKPKTGPALIKRDRELRTRFENGADILLDLINASKPLRV